jgi:hypothetical protein
MPYQSTLSSALDLSGIGREVTPVTNSNVMKTRIFPKPLLAIASLTALALSAMSVEAQDASTSTTTPNTVQTLASSQRSPVALSFGVPEILKLSRAQVSDDTIVAFIGNSGRTYNLTASEIVYLHDQGVSERVITTMLIQRRKVEEAPAPAAPPAPSAPATSAYAPSSTTYVQTPPAYVPSSTVYVVPSSSPTYTYYDSYPYYGGYYGYNYPAVSLAFGFGSYYGSGYYGRGYHGGGYWGGWHGGGSSRWGGWQGGGWQGGGSRGGGGWQGGGGSHGGGGWMGGGGSHGGGGSRGGGHH